MKTKISPAIRRRQHSWADKFRLTSHPLIRACIAECLGTTVLVLIGCGSIAQVFLGDYGRGAHGNFISITLGWGMAVTVAAFISGHSGSGHINPAITLAFAIIGKFPFKYVPLYIIVQTLGGFFGGLVVFGIYYEKFYEFANQFDNGSFLISTSGKVLATYPGSSHLICFMEHIVATSILSAGILAIIDLNSWKMPKYLHPVYLFILVSSIVAFTAVNTGAPLNPARDFGPRIVMAMCGWGLEAFSGANHYFWIPIVGPHIGAILGAILYEITLGIHFDRPRGSVNFNKGEQANENDIPITDLLPE